MNCVPNPHTCSLGGRVITTVSGANITDILSNTNLKVGPTVTGRVMSVRKRPNKQNVL